MIRVWQKGQRCAVWIGSRDHGDEPDRFGKGEIGKFAGVGTIAKVYKDRNGQPDMYDVKLLAGPTLFMIYDCDLRDPA